MSIKAEKVTKISFGIQPRSIKEQPTNYYNKDDRDRRDSGQGI